MQRLCLLWTLSGPQVKNNAMHIYVLWHWRMLCIARENAHCWMQTQHYLNINLNIQHSSTKHKQNNRRCEAHVIYTRLFVHSHIAALKHFERKSFHCFVRSRKLTSHWSLNCWTANKILHRKVAWNFRFMFLPKCYTQSLYVFNCRWF